MGTLNPIDLKKDYKNRDFLDFIRWNADQAAIETAINKFISSITDGDSGADNLSMTAIPSISSDTKLQPFLEALAALVSSFKKIDAAGGSAIVGSPTIIGVDGNTVYQQLLSLKQLIDQIEEGVFPDGFIDNDKLANDIKVGSLATLATTIKTSLTAAINEVLGNLGDKANLTTAIKTSLVAASNEINSSIKTHLSDYEYQTPTIVGTQIQITKKSNSNILKFKLDADLTGGAITISLDAGATSKPLVNVDGVALTTLDKGFVEVISDALNFTLRPKGDFKIDALLADYVVAAGENINTGDLVEFINEKASLAKNHFGTELVGACIPAGMATTSFAAAKLDENRILLAYIAASNSLTALVIKITNNIFSKGTGVIINSGTCANVRAVTIDVDKVLVAYGESYGRANVLTISDMTITSGSTTTFLGSTNTSTALSLVKLDTNKALLAYRRDSGGYEARVATITGTAIAYGTALVIASSASTYLDATQLDSTRVLVAFNSTTPSGIAVILTITGTDISLGTLTTFRPTAIAYVNLLKIDTDKSLVLFKDSGGTTYVSAMVITTENDTITSGNILAVDLVTSEEGGIVAISPTEVLVTYPTNSILTAGKASLLKVSGTDITKELEAVIQVSENTGIPYRAIQMDSNKVFIYFGQNNVSSKYGYFNMMNCNKLAQGLAKTSGTEGQTIKCYDWRS